MSNAGIPHWKSNYPVRQSEEHEVSRRQFVKTTCGCAVGLGAGWVNRDKLFPGPASSEPQNLGSVDDLAVGDYKLFRYPSADQPCILVRLSDNEFAAFSQNCTHLACPVHYQHSQRRLYCPCHEGFFSAEDGRVLAGPPPRPLPRYPIEIRDGEIWISS